MEYFQTSAAIKIRFPNAMTQHHWAIEEQIQKTTYAVPFLAALMAVACTKPINKDALFEFLTSKISTQQDLLEKTLVSLIAKKIVFPTDNADGTMMHIRKWKEAGWDHASDYHFFTWDAPFLDYSKEGQGHDIDRKKMVSYQELQPDIERFKKYDNSLFSVGLPALDTPFSKIENPSIAEKIKYLLACVFGKKGEKPCHWSSTPLIRRTSPSGGSRHPTEGYFVTGAIEEIEQGFYHIQTDPPALRHLGTSDIDDLQAFESEKRPFPILGAIVLTTVFERNMYRYREPRTFRTVHMDIGHILASIETVSFELSLKATIQLHVNEEALLKKIRVSKLHEGVMAMVTLQKVG